MTPHYVSQFTQQLEALGFQPDGQEYRRNGMSVRLQPHWMTFHTEQPDDPPAAQVPGLWRSICSPDGQYNRVFELPLSTIPHREVLDTKTGHEVHPLGVMVDWAAATSSGTLPRGWDCPPREELEEGLSDKAFTLEVGQYARQGELRSDDQQLCVSIPLLRRIPGDLSPQRDAWLKRLLEDIQYRYRLVRLVENNPDGEERNVVAEVDLSGAPRFAVAQLIHLGLDAVRHVVSHCISTVELLVDPTVTSAVWDFPLVQDRPAEGSQQ